MKKKINIQIFIGLLLGILGGIILPDMMNNLSFLGTIYINLLKFIVIPVIFTTVMVNIYKTKKEKNNFLIKSCVTFLIMFISTFLLTSLIIYLINPSHGIIFDNVDWNGEITPLNITDIIINLFPSNLFVMFANNSVFASILVAFFCGYATIKTDNGDKVIEVVDGIKNVFYKLLEYIMYLTPIGVFSLIASSIANYGPTVIGIGAKYIGLAYLCSIITLFLIMILPVWIFAGITPIKYIKKIWKVWIMTFTTCSSAATMPYAIKTCNEEFGISSKITNIVIPLGCVIHFSGGAVSFALLGMFCSGIFGVPITFTTYLVMIINATLINVAAPGIPSGGIILGATYLSILNIPLSFIGIYSGIYRFLDMSYTTLNVTGNVSANILIAKRLKQ